MKIKEPTATTEALRYLREVDDLRRGPDIAKAVHKTNQQVSAALHYLLVRKAVDCVSVEGSRGKEVWWFALPPESDNRTKVLDERTPETKPRRKKAKKCVS